MQVENRLGSIVAELNQMLGKQQFVTEKTRKLREACETLVMEQEQLVDYLEQLDLHLQHFEQLEVQKLGCVEG